MEEYAQVEGSDSGSNLQWTYYLFLAILITCLGAWLGKENSHREWFLVLGKRLKISAKPQILQKRNWPQEVHWMPSDLLQQFFFISQKAPLVRETHTIATTTVDEEEVSVTAFSRSSWCPSTSWVTRKVSLANHSPLTWQHRPQPIQPFSACFRH